MKVLKKLPLLLYVKAKLTAICIKMKKGIMTLLGNIQKYLHKLLMLNLYTNLDNIHLTVEKYEKAEIDNNFSYLKKVRFIPCTIKCYIEAYNKIDKQRRKLSKSKHVNIINGLIERINVIDKFLMDVPCLIYGLTSIYNGRILTNNPEYCLESEKKFLEMAVFHGYSETDTLTLIKKLEVGLKMKKKEKKSLEDEIKHESTQSVQSLKGWEALYSNMVILGENNILVTSKSPMIHYVMGLNRLQEKSEDIEKMNNELKAKQHGK